MVSALDASSAPKEPDTQSMERAMARYGSAGVKVLSRAMKGSSDCGKQSSKSGTIRTLNYLLL